MGAAPSEEPGATGPVRRSVVAKRESSRQAALKRDAEAVRRGREAAERRKLEPRLPGMEEDGRAASRMGSTEPAPAPSASSARQRALLFGTPREVLARLSAGDPLELRSRVAAHLSRAHLLLDADRLQLRALAHCARKALQFRAADGVEAFLAGRVAEAADELVREDREALRHGRLGADGSSELSRPLGLDPARAREACSRFNAAPSEDRAACFALLVRGVELEQLARSGGATVTEVARRARRALELALVALEPHDPDATDSPAQRKTR